MPITLEYKDQVSIVPVHDSVRHYGGSFQYGPVYLLMQVPLCAWVPAQECPM